jgi:hypothetical protein
MNDHTLTAIARFVKSVIQALAASVTVVFHPHPAYHAGMLNNDDQHQLRNRLYELTIEHRDLDNAIEHMDAKPPVDELLLRRLKKRKLELKDRIASIERVLEPDVLA